MGKSLSPFDRKLVRNFPPRSYFLRHVRSMEKSCQDQFNLNFVHRNFGISRRKLKLVFTKNPPRPSPRSISKRLEIDLFFNETTSRVHTSKSRQIHKKKFISISERDMNEARRKLWLFFPSDHREFPAAPFSTPENVKTSILSNKVIKLSCLGILLLKLIKEKKVFASQLSLLHAISPQNSTDTSRTSQKGFNRYIAKGSTIPFPIDSLWQFESWKNIWTTVAGN